MTFFDDENTKVRIIWSYNLQGKWDQKQNINLVKITKKLTLFHKSRENIDENDSNPQGK